MSVSENSWQRFFCLIFYSLRTIKYILPLQFYLFTASEMTEFNLTKCLCSHYFVHIRCLNFMTRLAYPIPWPQSNLEILQHPAAFIVHSQYEMSHEMCKQYLTKYSSSGSETHIFFISLPSCFCRLFRSNRSTTYLHRYNTI